MATPDPVTGIGISWLWMLPDSHPFYLAAVYHDQQYQMRAEGLIDDETSARADAEFFRLCKIAAGSSIKYQAQARLFYGVVRAWGAFRWPVPSSVALRMFPVYRPVLRARAVDRQGAKLIGWRKGFSPWIKSYS